MIASTLAAPLTAAILTTVVIVVLSRRRRRRRSRRAPDHGVTSGSVARDLLDVGLIVGGIILAVGTLLVGTQLLHVQGVVGGDTALPAEEALGHASWNPNASFAGYDYNNTDNTTTLTTPLELALQTIVGNTTVAVDHGDVETSLSLPPPNALFDGNPKWTCENPALQVRPLPKSGTPPLLASASDPNAIPVFSLAGVEEQGLSDCSGLVVVAEAGSDSRLTLLLLLMGSLISLGAAVSVEVMLDWREFGLPFRRSRAGRAVEHAVEADAVTV